MKQESVNFPSRRKVLGYTGGLLGLGLGFVSAISESHNAGPTAFNVKNYGATGVRSDNATKAFRDAIEACASAGGGTVQVPTGEYTVGTVQLLNNITLHLESGATLFASQQADDYAKDSRAMIFAQNATNIAVIGNGTIDGLARYDYVDVRGADPEIAKEQEIARKAGIEMKRYYRSRDAMNIFLFVLNDCTHVQLRDVSIINAPLWTVRLNDCDRVSIRGIYIYSDLKKGVNADGIDVCSSKNVVISDCVITTADDSIVLKAIARNGKKANTVENVTVTNCVLTSSSTPLMIGTETEADIRHVIFSNCVIRNSNKGFGINVQDGATVSDIIFSNLTIETSRRHWNWWGDSEMCKFVLKKRKDTSPIGQIKDVIIDNISGKVRGTTTITGHVDQPLENIRISNVRVLMDIEDAKDKRATDAIRIDTVRGLRLRDVSVEWNEKETEPAWQSALVLKNVSNFTIDSFSGRQGLMDKDVPAMVLVNCADGIVRNSVAPNGTATFCHFSGDDTKEITLKDNKTVKAKKSISFEDDSIKKRVTIDNSSE